MNGYCGENAVTEEGKAVIQKALLRISVTPFELPLQSLRPSPSLAPLRDAFPELAFLQQGAARCGIFPPGGKVFPA